ncbi:MAG: hypothetical protein ACI4XR_05495 [Bacilli bacterium]
MIVVSNKKNIIKFCIVIIIMLLFTAACKQKNNLTNLTRTVYTPTETDYNIKKENLYGCWQVDTYDIYDGENVLFELKNNATFNFGKDEVINCYYNEDNNEECSTLDYSIDNNNLTIKSKNNDTYEKTYSIFLEDYKENVAYMTLSFIKEGKEHRYHLSISKECKLNYWDN